ncbi:ribonuclease T1 [Crossiella equi]|uniref:Ribonuclease T1 n=1 Tax=Crossiella equi TaxID=130796 RepID=A0ABS5AMR5_9PSEU|nr:ribonuclease domain-containing protein [Crossiella equi]MBP2476995.1 ribonuclease T1 [Crossiella equi]
MSQITSRAVKSLLAALITLAALLVPTTGTAVADTAGIAAACGDTSGFKRSNLSALPAQASDTVRMIRNNGPWAYPQDNTVFQNREKLLPLCDSGYYREYTVKTPGVSHRGARRVVKGNGNEYFYTADHYASFVLVNINA